MKASEPFRGNEWPTLGVEIELQLVDSSSMALRSAFDEIQRDVPSTLHDSVKPEFMQCYVEINTDVCRTAADVWNDLASKVKVVEEAASRHEVALFWAATHPFSRWQDQKITPNERYYKLADLFQETVIRPVTFGLHVHVGVESGDKAIRIMGRLHRYLPILLAISSNSPFWNGRLTGHHAHRIEVLEGCPTGGMPPRLDSWDEYLRLIGQLRKAGFIESHRELWWDVRPNAENGTIEVRICDMPPGLRGVVGLTALIQCLVHQLAQDDRAGLAEPDCHPLLIKQNRWRACRFGLGANLVDPASLEAVPAREAAASLIGNLRGVAADLGCDDQMEFLLELISGPTGSERQISLHEQTGELPEVVRKLVGESRLTQAPRHQIACCSGGLVDGDRRPAPYGQSVRTGTPAA